jgi:outer membrane protein assembly factor BamB
MIPLARGFSLTRGLTAMSKKTIGLGWVLAAWAATGWVGTAQAGNWPRFRGPNGTGLALDKGVPVEWSADKGVLWKTELPGQGNSSPVIWGNRLFTESATGKERFLLCVDVRDGKVLWSKAMAGGTTRKHPKNSFASSTPAVDGERVYAVFWDGSHVFVLACDLDGKSLWKRDLGSFRSQHGVGASPMIYRDKVFLNNDQDGASVLVALDAKTGNIAWQAKRRPFRACYSTPLILTYADGTPELIVASTAGITGYDPDRGGERWHWTWQFSNMPLRTVGSPVASHGIIFAGSGDGSGERHMVAVKAGGKGDVTKTNLIWERKRDFPYVPCMLTLGDYLFCVNDRGIASCYVAKNGAPVWDKRLGDNVSASPVLVDGKIYAITEKGDVYVFAAAATFKLLAKNSIGERVIASPAVADSRLFIRGERHLFCIGKGSAK